jgi:Domain of unknown function (DUF4907)
MQRYFIILLLLAACQAQTEQSSTKKATITGRQKTEKKSKVPMSFDIATIQGANGWGYQIRQNGKLVINQPTIPGRPGTAGFQTQQEAQNVAELVKAKLIAKVFPPTVSEDDLKNLNIH